MAEWSKAAVLKTVEGQPSQGSNPCLSAINMAARMKSDNSLLHQKYLNQLHQFVFQQAKKSIRLDKKSIQRLWDFLDAFPLKSEAIDKLMLFVNRLKWQNDEKLNALFIKRANRFSHLLKSEADKKQLASLLEKLKSCY